MTTPCRSRISMGRLLPSCPSTTCRRMPSRTTSPTASRRTSSLDCPVLSQFLVIARNSTFAYKGKTIDVRQVGRELGVRYVLEGSVRKSGSRVRITGQLVDASTGHHIWADRFDGNLADLFDLQDEITTSVIGAIQPSIRAAETARSQRKRPDNFDAYDFYMQALPHVASLERKGNTIGLGLLERALQLEPDYAAALAMAAWCHAQRCVYNWTEDPDDRKPVDVAARQQSREARGE